TVATLFSLFVSFTLTPVLAAKWSVLKRSAAPPKWLVWFQSGFDETTTWYKTRALPLALRHRWMTFWFSVLLVINAVSVVGGTQAMFVLAAIDVAIAVVLVPWLLAGRALHGRGFAGVRV